MSLVMKFLRLSLRLGHGTYDKLSLTCMNQRLQQAVRRRAKRLPGLVACLALLGRLPVLMALRCYAWQDNCVQVNNDNL